MRPNFERLRDAFAIIDGIPTAAFDLDFWTTREGGSLSCGTIACAGGWLARHPQFNALGLRIDWCGDVIGSRLIGYGALEDVFSLTAAENTIFDPTHDGYCDSELSYEQRCALTDKGLWKRRVLRLFQKHGEPFDPKVGEGLFLDQRGPV